MDPLQDADGTGDQAGGPEQRHQPRRRRTAKVQGAEPSQDAAWLREPAAPDGPALTPPEARARRRRRFSEFVPSWGLSPTFRVFLFLVGILGVLVFLFYNEYVIREFTRQERDRARLYSLLYGLAWSPDVPEGVSGEIFQKIISNRDISFPMILTDHRGEILLWKGPGLPPEADRSPAAQAQLKQAMAKMDAINAPEVFYERSEVQGRIYFEAGLVIITDRDNRAVVWAGQDLPAPGDTTAAAGRVVREALADWPEGSQPVPLPLPAAYSSSLHFDGTRYAITDHTGAPVAWGGDGLPSRQDTSAAALTRVHLAVQEISRRSGPPAFRVRTEKYIHFGQSDLISRISLAPFVSIGAVFLFALVGYMGFRNIRRSEQRSIWVGMAKETAHQLGTPLSSLSGWLELMQTRVGEGEGATESVDGLVQEMQKDMRRLTQIASRFSQIGSTPELRCGDVRDVLGEAISYFRRRGPQFGRHTFESDFADVPDIPMNAELMSWAFENLLKNAIDAIGTADGIISVRVGRLSDREAVAITIADNGRGIELEHVSRVFDPGFSTKKRGWGLGLAFVRRIVEEYHGGRIQVLRSEPGEGTTIEICLPCT